LYLSRWHQTRVFTGQLRWKDVWSNICKMFWNELRWIAGFIWTHIVWLRLIIHVSRVARTFHAKLSFVVEIGTWSVGPRRSNARFEMCVQ
jgi:hypothetical protein